MHLIHIHIPPHTLGAIVTLQVQVLVGCERARAEVQVSRREFHTYIHLD